jgi:hemolysin III
MSELYVAPYTRSEEFANALTHGVGFLVAVAALIHIISFEPLYLSVWQKTGVIVYGVSLILMFLASTLYHAVSLPEAKQVLKRCDHCAIYLLIAGSFTPLLTIPIESRSANILLIIVWSMALIGVVFKAFFASSYNWISVGTYLLMGWLGLPVVYDLYEALSTSGFTLLVTGGLAYSIGVFFYVNKSIPFNHAIWHCFVLLGATSHCWLIAFNVLQSSRIA